MNVSVFYRITTTGNRAIQDIDFNDEYDGVRFCELTSYEDRRFIVFAKTQEEIEARLKQIWRREKDRVNLYQTNKPVIYAIFRINGERVGYFDNEKFSINL